MTTTFSGKVDPSKLTLGIVNNNNDNNNKCNNNNYYYYLLIYLYRIAFSKRQKIFVLTYMYGPEHALMIDM